MIHLFFEHSLKTRNSKNRKSKCRKSTEFCNYGVSLPLHLFTLFAPFEVVVVGLFCTTPSACFELSVGCAELPLSLSCFICGFVTSFVDIVVR